MPDEIKKNDFEDFEDDDEMINPTRSALAAVAAGVLVIIAGFLVWNYLQNLGGNKNNSQDIQAILDEVNQDNKAEEENSSDEQVAGETPEEPISETVTPETKVETTKVAMVTTPKVTETYEVTDYNSGDIKTGKYVVKAGDTLWEIAEAVYGSGFDWQQIADANPNLVYTLANGNVGIDTGGTLTIPALK